MPQKIALGLGIIALVVTAAIMLQKQAPPARPADSANLSATPSPSPVPDGKEAIVSTVTSLTGEKKLILKNTVHKKEQTQDYALFNADFSDPIFTKTVSLAEFISIPRNSWAPEEKYVFIEKTNANGQKDYLVFQASGKPFAKGEAYFDVKELFALKKNNYTFKEATGWASPTLLIFTTLKEDGSKGSSFWFEVPSQAFLQLAR